MAGINKAIIVGRLGKDPEVKSFSNGGKVCNLSVATSEDWKDKSTGERKSRVEWHRVSILDEALVRIAEQYLRKGSEVYLEGQIETRKWQNQSGQDQYSTEIVLRQFNGKISLIGGKSSDIGGARDDGGQSHQGAASSGGGSGSGSSGRADMDDEIPF